MVCVFSLWHQPQLHFGHLMLPLSSDCAIPISCGREPGHIPIKGWGVGCCWPWNPVGWSQSAIASQKQKKQCELCQSHQNSHQCWALAKVRKANVPSRWALAPALEKECSQRRLGVCICCSVPEICLHGSCPVLQFFLSCAHSREAKYDQRGFSSSVSPGETCLYVMPLTYVVVSAPIMWWISLG